MPKKGTQQARDVLQLRVTLQDVEPPVWRRLEVPSDTTFARLHVILQVTMGWQNSHLHQFSVGDIRFGVPDGDFDGGPELKDERRARLRGTVDSTGTEVMYEYDFGDTWVHEILVEKVHGPEPGIRYPRVLDGARACPPEDIGGVGGYEDFLAAMADATHPEHDEMLEWIGFPFDPEWFNLVGLNRTLQSLR